MKVRDKLWMFGCRAHDDDIFLGRRIFENTDMLKWSRITPAEGAFMLDIPNMLLVTGDGVPAPYSNDAYGYAESFCRMDRVIWSSTGSAGLRSGNEEAFICKLAEEYPNIIGAMADDLMVKYEPDEAGYKAAKAEFEEIRAGLDKSARPLELWATLYTYQMDAWKPYVLDVVDTITMWTWDVKDLKDLEKNFEKVKEQYPNKKKVLGIYFFDYPAGRAYTDEEMEYQCSYGLKLLQEGQIEGLLFCDNCVMGVRLPSEFWLRNWIQKVKNIEL